MYSRFPGESPAAVEAQRKDSRLNFLSVDFAVNQSDRKIPL